MSDSTAWIEALEALDGMIDAVAGYREKCERAGFSPTVAEQMAVQFHGYLLAIGLRSEK